MNTFHTCHLSLVRHFVEQDVDFLTQLTLFTCHRSASLWDSFTQSLHISHLLSLLVKMFSSMLMGQFDTFSKFPVCTASYLGHDTGPLHTLTFYTLYLFLLRYFLINFWMCFHALYFLLHFLGQILSGTRYRTWLHPL